MHTATTTVDRLWRWWCWIVLFTGTFLTSAQPTGTSTATTRISKAPNLLTPRPVVYPASCAADGTWYLQGGYHLEYLNATYSLDLTIPWNTAKAPWIQLPTSPNISTSVCIASVNDTFHFQGLGSTDTVLSFFGNENIAQPFMTLYDVTSQTWIQNVNNVTVPSRSHDQVPVGNPLDGKIYTRGGYLSNNASTMDVYSPTTNTFKSLPIPVSAAPSGSDTSTGGLGVPISQAYSTVWCSQRSSILYFGGRSGDVTTAYVLPSIFEYFPANNTWAALGEIGKGPTAREDACMATDQDCSKVVVFAGQDADTILADIHVLDLATMQWTMGPASTDGRLGMTCTMFDDGFLVWGGASDIFLTTFYPASPFLFNVSTMRWSTGYKMTDLTSAPTPTPSKPEKSLTLALSLGLAIGALGIVAVSGGLLLYRRERKKAVKRYGRIQGPLDEFGGVSKHGKDLRDTVRLSKGPKGKGLDADQRTATTSSSSISSSPLDTADHSQRRKWQMSLGHKIELSGQSSEGVDLVMDFVPQSKQEDPTFIPQSRPIAITCPTPAPSSLARPSTLSALPPGALATVPAVVPLENPHDATPSAPALLQPCHPAQVNDSIEREAETDWMAPQSFPYNPNFIRHASQRE